MASEESQNVPQDENQEGTEPKLSQKEIEKMEEEKLKARYNNARPVTGSAFLQKRLAKGQKFFDSGDYQMAKQKGPSAVAKIPSAANSASATNPAAAPTVQPTMSSNLSGHPTGDVIPTPESVPTRKTSIIQQSKLAVSPASPAM